MKFQTYKFNRKYSTNNDGTGLFVLDGGAYRQLRGNGQTPVFKTLAQFEKFLAKTIIA